MTTIDLNADLGEGCAFDLELLELVSSCNIACGGHAGDEQSIAATVQHALAQGVAIGAHPSYPDREGFGRRSTFLTGDDLKKSLLNQLYMIDRVVCEAGAKLTHVKPHGALYNDAATEASLAELFVGTVQNSAAAAAIVGPPQSALQHAAEKARMRFIAEAFVDRAYQPDGSLVSRSEPNAVHGDINTMTTQAVTLAKSGTVTAENGDVIQVRAGTLCIHGDTPNAAEIARAVRNVLLASGVDVHAAT